VAARRGCVDQQMADPLMNEHASDLSGTRTSAGRGAMTADRKRLGGENLPHY
jgi:hypothetical protein